MADGALSVIGPTEDYYDSLVPKFRDFKASQSLRSMIAAGVEEKTGKAPGETLDHETLENGAADRAGEQLQRHHPDPRRHTFHVPDW